jgi:hypothetical protein
MPASPPPISAISVSGNCDLRFALPGRSKTPAPQFRPALHAPPPQITHRREGRKTARKEGKNIACRTEGKEGRWLHRGTWRRSIMQPFTIRTDTVILGDIAFHFFREDEVNERRKIDLNAAQRLTVCKIDLIACGHATSGSSHALVPCSSGPSIPRTARPPRPRPPARLTVIW